MQEHRNYRLTIALTPSIRWDLSGLGGEGGERKGVGEKRKEMRRFLLSLDRTAFIICRQNVLYKLSTEIPFSPSRPYVLKK